MKVLEIFGEPVASGGQESFIFNVLRHIDRRDLTMDFFTPYYCSNREYQNLIEACGGRLYCAELPFQPGASRRNIIRPLRQILTREHDGAVHIHSGSSSVLAYAAFAAHRAGVRNIIVHSHCTVMRENLKYRLTRAYTSFFFHRYPTQFCACSLAAGECKFSADIVESKLRIINNGIDLERFAFRDEVRKVYREKLELSPSTVLIGHVGRFSEQKNHAFDLAVLQELKARAADVKLLWIGEGELEQALREQIAERNLQDLVLFGGVVSNVQDYLQAMDIFILPSFFEGLPIVGVEAQAAGLPVLASDRVSGELKLTDSVQFLSLDNPSAWADRILQLAGERRPDNSARLEKQGYGIQTTAAAVRDLYFS